MSVTEQLQQLYTQAQEIERLNDRLSDLLRSNQLIEFYVQDRLAHPDSPALSAVLERARQLKSYPIVMYGLKEIVDEYLAQNYPGQNLTSVLEPKEQLENRATDWLTEGDILVGFSGVTKDDRGPRIIAGTTEDGSAYLWRYIAQPDMEPRAANHDRYFRRRDWIKVDVASEDLEDVLAEVELIQKSEVEGLQQFVVFLETKAFLEV